MFIAHACFMVNANNLYIYIYIYIGIKYATIYDS